MWADLTFLGATAVGYAEADMAVFPLWWVVPDGDGFRCACRRGVRCKSPGKHPLFPPAHLDDEPPCRGECGRLGHGVHDATADAPTVERWWTREPDANIGLAADRNGFAILDVDPRHGGDESLERLRAAVAERTGVDLMDTLVQRTGGGGLHLVFQAPKGGIKSDSRRPLGDDLPGIDTRGRGAYVVAWPSVHVSGREYEWVDFLRDPAPWPEILTHLMEPSKPPATGRPGGHSGTVGTAYGRAALDGEVRTLRGTAEGGRNDQLNRSAVNLGTLVASGVLSEDVVRDELTAAALAIGLSRAETARTITSGLRFGLANPRPPAGAA